MKTKYVHVVLVLLLFAICLASCNNIDNDELHELESENLTSTEMTIEETSVNETERQQSTDSIPEETTVQQEDETTGEPPIFLKFNNIEQIDAFIQAANGTSEQYEQYQQTYDHYELRYRDQTFAKTIADELSGHYYPFLKPNTEAEIGEISYAYDQNNLAIIYRVNGVRYRFIYRYGEAEVFQYEGSPVIDDLPIYNTTMDLYQPEDWIVGFVTLDTLPIFVNVSTDNPEAITMEHFEFREIGS